MHSVSSWRQLRHERESMNVSLNLHIRTLDYCGEGNQRWEEALWRVRHIRKQSGNTEREVTITERQTLKFSCALAGTVMSPQTS